MSSSDLQARIAHIEERNKRVEMDKRRETSWTRRLSISLLTYLVIALYLIAIHKEQPFINALVPAIGFFLSTLVLKSSGRQSDKSRRTIDI
jgi:hypothetical protein